MALMGDANVQSNELIIGELVQRELIAASKIVGTVLDVSRYAQAGQKAIEFPKAGSFTVVKKASLTPVTEEALTYTTDKLDLDQHAVIQWLLEDKAGMQSVVDIELDAVSRAARAHAKQVDVDILAALREAPISVTGNAGGALRREDIVAALTALDSAETPDDGRFFAINPAEKADMFNISDFIDSSKFGASQAPAYTGQIGQVFGVPVIVSTNVTAGSPLMYHNEAAAIGFQMAPRFQSDLDLANLGMRYSLDQLYGVKGLINATGLTEQMSVELSSL